MKQVKVYKIWLNYGSLKKTFAFGFRIDKYSIDLDLIFFYVSVQW